MSGFYSKDEMSFHVRLKSNPSVEISKDDSCLIINLKNNDIIVHDNSGCCFFCRSLDTKVIHYRGVYICCTCAARIGNAKEGTVIY